VPSSAEHAAAAMPARNRMSHVCLTMSAPQRRDRCSQSAQLWGHVSRSSIDPGSTHWVCGSSRASGMPPGKRGPGGGAGASSTNSTAAAATTTSSSTNGEEKLTRIAIVSADRCKPRKCALECKRSCPVNRIGKLCIEVMPSSPIALISESLCIGCGICVRKCPFGAIQIINLPTDLDSQTTHRYSANSFKLHRLPMPRPGQVLGLVGGNGQGKSTALKILAAKLKPNLGNYKNPPDWPEILRYFRGSELQNYFEKILREELRAVIKPQYVDHIPKAVKGRVRDLLAARNETERLAEVIDMLDLEEVLDRDVSQLSGGELQRFAIAMVCLQRADAYMFDEPSSYLDVRQRLRAARAIRSLCRTDNYVLVVEHDLAVLDYLSDYICVLYGVPGAYGVVTYPFSVREGINVFLAGFVPTENMRFRETELTFKIAEGAETPDAAADAEKQRRYGYPAFRKTLGSFVLDVERGEFTDSEIVLALGRNGTGKTTLIRVLAGLLQPDPDPSDPEKHIEIPQLNVSYKPQKISPSFEGTVQQLLHKRIQSAYTHPQFQTDVLKPLSVDKLFDQEVKHLSGGELQRVALVLALGKPADLYLLDEPSAYLDSEQRIIAAKVIKRFILHSKKTAFIVEHDFIMATYLADRVIVYEGEPARKAVARSPEPLVSGMNRFLRALDITFRRDPTNLRPRINKHGSVKDQEQKASGNYFFADGAPTPDTERKAKRKGKTPGSERAAHTTTPRGNDDEE